GDARQVWGDRPEHEGRDVLGRQAEQEIWISDLALVMRLLGVRQPRKRRACRSSARRERPGARPMWYAVVPVETRAPALAESRNERAQLRVHRSAVIALVVILHDDLPVRLDVVHDLRAAAQVVQRIADQPVERTVELFAKRHLRLR